MTSMVWAMGWLTASSSVARGYSMAMWGIVRLWGKRETILVVLYQLLEPCTLTLVYGLKVRPFIMLFFIPLPPDFELEAPTEPPGIDKFLNGEFIFVIDLHRWRGDSWLSRDRVQLRFGQQVDMEDIQDPPLVSKTNSIGRGRDSLSNQE